jgi:Tfp pilus assembly protein PilF
LNLKSEDPVIVHYRLARALLKTQDLDGAVAELHEVIRSGDKNWSADAHLCLASAFDRKGDPKAAQEHRRIAFQIDPYPNHGMRPPAPVLPPPPPPPPKIEKHFVAM